MRKIILSAMVVALFGSSSLIAQERYVEESFSDVTVLTDVSYGENYGIITQAPVLEDLKMDVYTPNGDVATDRPTIIILHTGSFLPPVANGQATGSKNDNAVVEMCNEYAKKGYVAVALSYRLGWNPLGDENTRRSTLIQAAYRGLQDVSTAVRFMRKSMVDNDNPYGINGKFAVGGLGTGGYISLAAATLNNYDDELLLPKFIDTSDPENPIPYIIPAVHGDFYGTTEGFIPGTETQLCKPNHVTYDDDTEISSDIDMVFNLGGALPDISWLDEGEVPIATVHCIKDPNAPYAVGNIIVPTTGEVVVEAMGAETIHEAIAGMTNNDVFDGLPVEFNSTASTYNNTSISVSSIIAGHDAWNGLFPIGTPAPSTEPTPCGADEEQGAPWDWWDNATFGAQLAGFSEQVPTAEVGQCLGLLGNQDMSEAKGKAFVELSMQFLTPRIYQAFDIGNFYGIGVDENEITSLEIYPNPAESQFEIQSNSAIESIKIYSITGNLVKDIQNVNATNYTVQRNEMTSGVYIISIVNENSTNTRRLILK